MRMRLYRLLVRILFPGRPCRPGRVIECSDCHRTGRFLHWYKTLDAGWKHYGGGVYRCVYCKKRLGLPDAYFGKIFAENW